MGLRASLDRQVFLFRRNLLSMIFIREALIRVAIWNFCYGSIVLICRAALSVSAPGSDWLWGGIIISLLFALHATIKRMPSTSEYAAIIDSHCHCGGILMACTDGMIEIPADSYDHANLKHPRLVWKKRTPFTIFFTAAVYVLLSLVIPQNFIAPAQSYGLDIARHAEKLQAKIEILKQESIMNQARAENLIRKLDQLKREASGEDPTKTFEAMDHIEDIAVKVSNKAAEDLMKKLQQLDQACELLKNARNDPADMTFEQKQEMMSKLSDAIASDAYQAGNTDEGLSSFDLSELFDREQNCIDSEKLQSLLESMGKRAADIRTSMCELSKTGYLDKKKICIIDPETAKKLKDLPSAADGKETDAYALSPNGSDNAASASALIFIPVDGQPGQGGVSRGGGPVPMTFKDPTDPSGSRFKDELLPQAGIEALDDTTRIGVSISAPQIETDRTSTTGNSLNQIDSADGSAHDRKVLPRYRNTVKRYFERRK